MSNHSDLSEPFPDDSATLPEGHRSGYVALLGRPNVGKSTLMNAWIGTKLAPVSPKPQTTRTQLLGILTRPDAQVVFVDTPGVHLPRTKLGEYMVKQARSAIPDADVVVFLVDVSSPPDAADRAIAALLAGVDVPVLLALNKVDLVSGETLADRREAYEALGAFTEGLSVSATQGAGVPELLEAVIRRLPPGPRYYPEDQLSDQQERFVAAELVREQALRLLEQEVPHALAVLVDDFKERDNGVLYVAATIYTERDSQKGIVIGRRGQMLKRIGQEARRELETFFERQVFLELWVKVRRNWRRSERDLREFGYDLRDG